jgi:hypothetical protein
VLSSLLELMDVEEQLDANTDPNRVREICNILRQRMVAVFQSLENSEAWTRSERLVNEYLDRLWERIKEVNPPQAQPARLLNQ